MTSALQLLGVQALLGTSRRTPELPVSDDPCGQMLGELAVPASAEADKESDELRLLRGAGVLFVCGQAGYLPSALNVEDVMLPPPCPHEDRPMLPERDAVTELYRTIFSEKNVRLQRESLRYLDARGTVLPPSLLVAALNLGRVNRSLRPLLARVIGERGLWLASLNPDWNLFAVSTTGKLNPEAWEHGRPAQRQAYFLGAREENPGQARELFLQDMKSMDAAERNTMLSLFSAGLSMEDEDVLEDLLRTDRSRDVRHTAADLLARLPDSRYVARMGERLLACMKHALEPEADPMQRNHGGELRHTAGLFGRLSGNRSAARAGEGLLARMKHAFKSEADPQLRSDAREFFAPPESYDASWAADLIGEKSTIKAFGPRAFWLYRMAVSVPLSWWTKHTGRTPEELIALTEHSEWKNAIRCAWGDALIRDPDPDWARAMLACGGIWECAVRRDLDQMDLLCLLLPEEREKERVRRLTPENLVPMLTKALAPEGEDYVMSREFAQRIFDVLRIRLSRKNRDYELGGILTELAQLLPADMLDENAHPLSFKEGERPDLEEALAAFSVIVLRRRALCAYFS